MGRDFLRCHAARRHAPRISGLPEMRHFKLHKSAKADLCEAGHPDEAEKVFALDRPLSRAMTDET